MKLKNSLVIAFSACASLLLASQSLVAEDWPQWMGQNRDGVYTETGLVDEIPSEGLPVKWRVPVELGYAGPAVANGKVFVSDFKLETGKITNGPGTRDALAGLERVSCFDAASGKFLWRHEYPRTYKISYPSGPRCTPTVDGDRVYALGAEGDLVCLKSDSGELLWKMQLAEKYGVEAPIWGYAAHPLVYGDLLFTLAGGKDSLVVALNKMTGEPVWQALNADSIGYCPPSIVKLGGKDTLLVWHPKALNALDPKSGALLWDYPLAPRYEMSIAAPQLRGNKLYASGIGQTCAMIQLDADGKPEKAVWSGKSKQGLYAANSTPLFEEEAIYGSDCDTGLYIAVNPTDGSRFWQTFELTTGGKNRASHGTAFTVRNDDKHLIFTETGDLVIAKLSPEGFEEKGRMHVLEPTGECFSRPVVWSHPAYANKCLFARNDKEIVCVDLAASK